MDEERSELVGTSVTKLDKRILRAVAFLEGNSVSAVIYGWLKPHLDVAAQEPEVRTIIAQKERVVAGES